jgi:hypothetical protein
MLMEHFVNMVPDWLRPFIKIVVVCFLRSGIERILNHLLELHNILKLYIGGISFFNKLLCSVVAIDGLFLFHIPKIEKSTKEKKYFQRT